MRKIIKNILEGMAIAAITVTLIMGISFWVGFGLYQGVRTGMRYDPSETMFNITTTVNEEDILTVKEIWEFEDNETKD